VELPPGSRYVPQRRAVRGAPLRPSLASLGLWPLRAMFASLRPQAVARVAVPILVMMPLGTTADVALLAIGLSASLAAILLLLVWMWRIGGESRRWLQPLPLSGGRIVGHIVARGLPAILGCAATSLWLLWLITQPGPVRR